MSKTYHDTSRLFQAVRIATLTLALITGIASGAQAADDQEEFDTPEQAADALAAAWRAGSKTELLNIFGPDAARLVSSGDDVADQTAKAKLAAEYDAQHKIESKGERMAELVIGKGEFPFPIPLVKEAGSWRFDTAAGEDEILNRRVGRNELNVIKVCRAYVEAQREYAAREHPGKGRREYAMKLVSSAGKHDGLYWPAKTGDKESPLGPLVARAAAEGYRATSTELLAPYHGYYYRILTRQGGAAPGGASDYAVKGKMTKGFALVAFPAQYGNSGVMTFLVNHDGIVFEKNLGPNTTEVAQQITEYNPDRTWKTAGQ
ncbi:MAG TPA: DUF2950 domain-containing protein [Gallionella sp.]|nr:DUF2950 domain-containing protein [Gallionella sp.]